MTTTVMSNTGTKSKIKKSISYRFVLTAELEQIISYLEHLYIGLDRSEILKLALNTLYRSNIEDKSILNEIANTPKRLFNDENKALDWLENHQ